MLDHEIAFFEANRPEWETTHRGEFVLVKDSGLIGMYATMDQALAAGAREFGLTSFLVRQIGAAQEAVSFPALTLGLLGANP